MKHISEISVFDMSRGMKVWDKKLNQNGTILEIKETAPEWIEPIVQWENGQIETLKSFPQYFIVFD